MKRFARVLAVFLLPFQVLFATGVPIALVNPSFEDLSGTDPLHFDASGKLKSGHASAFPDTPPDSSTFTTVDAIPGWVGSTQSGTVNPPPFLIPGGASDGSNCAWVNGSRTISQSLTNQFQANTLYRLHVDVGSPKGVPFPGYSIGLYSGTQTVTLDPGSIPVSSGSFITATVSVLILPNSPLVGTPIQIKLGSLGQQPGQVYFDNVRLTMEAPGSCAPMPSGSVGWWRGDGPNDSIGAIGGTFRGGATTGAGYIGSGLSFPGGLSALTLNQGFALSSQDFSVELWIKRSDSTRAGTDFEAGQFFAGSANGFSFGLTHPGRLYLSHVGIDSIYSTTALTDKAWHHVAMTRGGTTLRFYLDGTLTDTLPCAVNYDMSGPFAIGGLGTPFGGVGYGFLGAIDELAVYNRELSPTEINSIYSEGTSGKCGASAALGFANVPDATQAGMPFRYQLSFTNNGSTAITDLQINDFITPNTPITAVSATLGSVSSLGGFVSSSVPVLNPGNSVQIDIQLNPSASTGSFLTNIASAVFFVDGIRYSASLTPVATRVIGPPLPPPTGIVAWWRGEGSALDSAGNNTGILAGHAAYASGLVGNSFSFDGIDSSIQLGSANALRLQDLTIETWIKRGSATQPSLSNQGYAAIFAGGLGNYSLVMLTDGRISYSQVGTSRIDSAKGIADTNWHHVAVTRSADRFQFFIDGTDAGSGPYSPTLTLNTPFAIGSLAQSVAGPGFEPFFGQIDELTVYNRALTSGEISQIFNAYSNGKATGMVSVFVSGAISAPIPLGTAVEYQLLVTNTFSQPINSLHLTHSLPKGWTVATETPSQGSLTNSPGSIRWEIGTLGAGATATLNLSTLPNFGGQALLKAVLEGGPDANLGGSPEVEFTLSVVGQPFKVQLFQAGSGDLRVRFHMVSGKSYELQRSTSLTTDSWSFVGDSHSDSGEADAELFDPLAGDSQYLFYRVVVTDR